MWRRYLRFVIGNFCSRFVGASRHPHAGGLDGQGVDDCGGSAISPTPDLLDVTAPGLGSLPDGIVAGGILADGIEVTINAPVNEFPVAAKQIPCSDRNRETSARYWNYSINGRRSRAESTDLAGNFKNSLLFSLFSGNFGRSPSSSLLAPGARLARKPVLPLRQAARTTHSRASRAARSAPPLRPSGVEAGQSSAPTFHHDTAHRLHLLSCNLTIAYSKSCQSLTIHQVTPDHGQSDASSSWPTYHSSC